MLKQGEIYDRKAINVDIYFAEKIAKIDLDPECDRTAQNSSVLSPKPVHVAIKQ
jgi:hypothetical protein